MQCCFGTVYLVCTQPFRSALLAYELLFPRAEKLTKKALTFPLGRKDYTFRLYYFHPKYFGGF
jgi:hypothetical protein